MARINTNVSSMIAQSKLARSNSQLQTTLQRLATGYRINRGADDPAGLIVSERLRTELAGLNQGVKNSERASGVISTTEGSLAEVSDLLNSIKALVVEAANTGAVSPEEINANQLQIDSAIDSITRIANTASFAGLKLLNGSLSYTTSGLDNTKIVKNQFFGVTFADRSTVDVNVEVLGSAQTAKLFLNTDWTVANSLPSTVTLEISGRDGVDEITFTSGTTVNAMIDAINSRSATTGVHAARVNASDATSGIVLTSLAFGSDAFAAVKRLSGGTVLQFARLQNDAPGMIDWATPASYTAAETDSGRDVSVLVNGALATGRGLEVTVRNPNLDMKLLLSQTFGTTVNGTPEAFVITGGGARYQLGPQITAQQQVNIGLNSVAATRLGGTYVTLSDGVTQQLQFLSSLKSGGANKLNGGNLANASRILETAIDEISTVRGRLGAFERNILQTNVRSLQAGIENITASDSIIRDTDFAKETSELTRAQILVSAGTSVLATANANSQVVLQLLG
ncbi:MAG TPA: flagellin [Phycisphaerales bacterium]|nr:flagellin [Phycisphaerales bacterium]